MSKNGARNQTSNGEDYHDVVPVKVAGTDCCGDGGPAKIVYSESMR